MKITVLDTVASVSCLFVNVISFSLAVLKRLFGYRDKQRSDRNERVRKIIHKFWQATILFILRPIKKVQSQLDPEFPAVF